MSRLKRFWANWVSFWDSHDAPWGLAMVRILLSLVLFWDLSWIALEDLVVPLWGPVQVGGWGDVLSRGDVPFVWRHLPPTVASTWAIWGSLMALISCIGLGIFPRVTTVLFVLLYAQTASIMDDADRGIDTMMRNVLLLLWWSPAWDVLSVHAWRTTGSFLGDGSAKPSWARRLLILQLVVMYFGAGVTKTGLGWMPWGGFTALYYILHDPAVARFDLGRTFDPFYFLTQISTAVSICWEYSSPLLLLFLWYRETPERPGRLRAWSVRWRPERVLIFVGAVFHLGIAVGMNLGIFPFAMLAMYPVFVAPQTWRRWFPWLPAGQPTASQPAPAS